MGSGGYSRAKFLILGAGIALAVLAAPRQALADCANPAAPEGRLVYNATAKIAQVCDGTNWISLGGSGGGGGGASALVSLTDVDAASAGEGDVLIYNTVSGKWESGPPPGGSAGNDTEVIFNDSGALSGNASFVFDKDNIRLGIGTATPGESVDVTGIVTADGLTLKSVAADAPLATSLELGDLVDVDTSAAADGLVLKYNGTSSLWEAASGGSASQWTDAGSDIYFSGGNVGIGGAPTDNYDFDIKSGVIRILNPTSDGWSEIDLFSGRSVSDEKVWNIANNGYSGAFQIRALDDARTTALVDALNILRNGNVGIGTTNPTSRLEIQGDAGAPELLNVGGTSNGVMRVRHIQGKQAASAGNDTLYLNYLGGFNVHVGGSQNANLVVYGTGTTCVLGSGTGASNCTSDLRLKRDVAPIRGALSKIANLRGVTFHWVDEERSEGEEIGVIAQEVESEFPQVVGEVDGYKTVDYAALVAPLIEAVKELKVANDNLRVEHETDIQALRAELESLRSSLGR